MIPNASQNDIQSGFNCNIVCMYSVCQNTCIFINNIYIIPIICRYGTQEYSILQEYSDSLFSINIIVLLVSYLINFVICLHLAPSDRVPPIIRQGPANQTFAPGATAQLQCYVMGSPLPSIQWERDGQRILGNDERISLMENGSLQITDLQVLYRSEYDFFFFQIFVPQRHQHMVFQFEPIQHVRFHS